MSTEAFVTPAVLRWARERDRVSPEEAARRVNVDREKLLAWESGVARPTIRQAQNLAKALKVPFGALYLPAPPEERLPLPDLRTVGNEDRRQPSTEMRDLINSVVAKQEWYREHQLSEDAPRLTFIGRFSTRSGYDVIATDIRNTIGITSDLRQKARGPDEYLRSLVANTEKVGILVLRNGVVANNTHRPLNVGEFRGFAISDDLAPLIFINGDDAKVAQIFTLLHELAHLWMGESGIDDPDIRSSSPVNASEQLCNEVAAEALVPTEELRSNWDSSKSADANIEGHAKRFKVSALVILRKAYDIRLLTERAYRNLYARLSQSTHTKVSVGGGGDFYATLYTRNSHTLVSVILAALSDGRVLYTEAARLLDLRVGTLDRVIHHEPVR